MTAIDRWRRRSTLLHSKTIFQFLECVYRHIPPSPSSRERCFVNGIESIICCWNTPHRVKLYWLLPEVRYQKAFPTHESFIIFFCNNCELRFLSFFSSQSTSLNKSTATKNFLNWNLFNWKSFEGEFIAYVVVATQHLEHIPHRDRAHAQWGSR